MVTAPADGPVLHRRGADAPVPLQGRHQYGLGQAGGRSQHLATVEGGPPERLRDKWAAYVPGGPAVGPAVGGRAGGRRAG
ncbi:MAG: hypothetical protein ACLP5E_22580, partial [Streptosporangiaceae bacterium]